MISNRKDRLALLEEAYGREKKLAIMRGANGFSDSEVYEELEIAEINKLAKTAQTLSDKIVQSPTAQQAIRDGIAKALENKVDDSDPEYEEFKANVEKLELPELMSFFNLLADNLERRGVSLSEVRSDDAEIKGPTEEELEKMKLDDDNDAIIDYVKSSLEKLAHNCADNGETEAAYIIERFIQKYATITPENYQVMPTEDLMYQIQSFGYEWADEERLNEILEEVWDRNSVPMAKAFLLNKQIPHSFKTDIRELLKDIELSKQLNRR